MLDFNICSNTFTIYIDYVYLTDNNNNNKTHFNVSGHLVIILSQGEEWSKSVDSIYRKKNKEMESQSQNVKLTI